MTDIGFMVLNSDLQVQSCNEQVCRLLGIGNGTDHIKAIRELIFQNPQFLQSLQKARNGENGAESNLIMLKGTDQAMHSFKMTFIKSLEMQESEQILVLLEPADRERFENIHLRRSFKYNTISKLAASVAHEIRNPLSSLAIQTEILDNILCNLQVNPDQQVRLKKTITILNSELDRIVKIIDQFFNLSRPGGTELNYEDVNSILREIYNLIRQQCYEQGVKITLEPDKTVPFIYVNRDQVIQVLLNLVINSLEAMPEGGTLILRSLKNENRVRLEIEDTGGGISPEIEDYLFQHYFSGHHKGGGVSLVLSRQIITDMGGRISFERGRTSGARFMIELPKAPRF